MAPPATGETLQSRSGVALRRPRRGGRTPREASLLRLGCTDCRAAGNARPAGRCRPWRACFEPPPASLPSRVPAARTLTARARLPGAAARRPQPCALGAISAPPPCQARGPGPLQRRRRRGYVTGACALRARPGNGRDRTLSAGRAGFLRNGAGPGRRWRNVDYSGAPGEARMPSKGKDKKKGKSKGKGKDKGKDKDKK